MSAEIVSPPESPPSKTSPETVSSYSKRIAQFYEDQKIYSKVNSRLFHSFLMDRLRKQYEFEYEREVKRALVAFESSRAIPVDKKDLIRKTVHDSIGNTKALDAFNGGPLAVLLYALLLLSGILVLILSGLVWHPLQRSLLEWIGYYLVAFLVLLLIIRSSFWLFMKSGRRIFSVLTLFFILFAPSFLFFWSQQYEWRAQFSWLGDAITVGSLSGVIANIGIITGLLAVGVWNSYQELQKLKKHPQGEFICKSIDTLMRLGDPTWALFGALDTLYNPPPSISSNLDDPSAVVHDLERMSLSLEYLLTQDLKDYDAYTQTWMEQSAHQMADDVRKLKQSILLPVEGSHQQVIEAVAHKLVLVAQGNWGQLERCELPPRQTRRVKLMAWLRGVISLAIPAALVLALQLFPLPINDALKNSLTTLAIGWAIVALLNLIDPDAINQIKEGADLAGLLKK